MKIRIELEDELVRRARFLAKEDDTAVAIRKAVETYVNHATAEGIKRLAGRIQFDEDWLEQYRKEHPLRKPW
jgi:hypothetical protein